MLGFWIVFFIRTDLHGTTLLHATFVARAPCNKRIQYHRMVLKHVLKSYDIFSKSVLTVISLYLCSVPCTVL